MDISIYRKKNIADISTYRLNLAFNWNFSLKQLRLHIICVFWHTCLYWMVRPKIKLLFVYALAWLWNSKLAWVCIFVLLCIYLVQFQDIFCHWKLSFLLQCLVLFSIFVRWWSNNWYTISGFTKQLCLYISAVFTMY